MNFFNSGTETSGPLLYTVEQEQTIEEIGIKDVRGLRFIKEQYVNYILAPDGRLHNTEAAHGAMAMAALLDPNADSRQGPSLSEELSEHIAQKRFLFVVNSQGQPVIYFQVATKNNPEYVAA